MERRLSIWETGTFLTKRRVFLFQFNYDEQVKQDLLSTGATRELAMSVVGVDAVSAYSLPADRDHVGAVRLLCGRWDFRPDSAALMTLESLEDPGLLQRLADSLKPKVEDLSRKAETDFYPKGLEQAAKDGVRIELYPFQRAGVEYCIDKKRVIVGDEPGLGKTCQAIATVEHLDAYPAIVVCPASLKYNWEREIQMWVPHRNISMLSGKPKTDWEWFTDEHWIIINYDILGHWLEGLRGLRPGGVVFDEFHYVKTYGTNRTRLSQRLVQGDMNRAQLGIELAPEWHVPVRLGLTGTAAVNKPSELLSQLSILDRLGEFGGYANFKRYYCGESTGRGRYQRAMAGGATPRRLIELNAKLRETCYVRREKEQVLTELPPKIRSTVMLDIDNWPEYLNAERDIAKWIAEQAVSDDEFITSLADMSLLDKEKAIWERRASAYASAKRAEALVRFAKLKWLAAQGKMQMALAWIREFIDQDQKIIVFAHHNDVVHKLGEELKAPVIAGSTPITKRQQYVDLFQTDPDCKAIVLNMAAGGLGLTLTAASNVAFVELGWTPAVHDQCEDRAHRIGQRDSVTAWYLLGRNTVDERIEALIARKRETVEATNIGKYKDEKHGDVDLSILAELTKYMLEKARQTRED